MGTAADKAREVLRKSAVPEGFVASADLSHYTMLWTRDVAFSAMGAHATGDRSLVDTVARSLVSLARTQSPLGQIANSYEPRGGHWDYHESGSTDATCLFVVAACQQLRAFPDSELRQHLWPHLERACRWLQTQDANGFSLIDSPMGGDWMDSTLQRSGKLLYVNACYQRALRGMAEIAPTPRDREGYAGLAELVKRKLNFFFWPTDDEPYAVMLDRSTDSDEPTRSFPHAVGAGAHAASVRADRGFYLSHVEGQQRVEECDVLANVLAVLFGIADAPRARTIMSNLEAAGAGLPYPARSYLRPLPPGDRWGMYKYELDRFQAERWQNPPGAYHNGGIWPFIGGLYVAALVRVGMDAAAGEAMDRLTLANRLAVEGEWGFHEWIHADTAEPAGTGHQAWSAGCYLLACQALGDEKLLL